MNTVNKFIKIKECLYKILKSKSSKDKILTATTQNYLEMIFLRKNPSIKSIDYFYSIILYLCKHRIKLQKNKRKITYNQLLNLKEISITEEYDEILRNNRTSKNRYDNERLVVSEINQKVPLNERKLMLHEQKYHDSIDKIINKNDPLLVYFNNDFINIITNKSLKFWKKIKNSFLNINIYYEIQKYILPNKKKTKESPDLITTPFYKWSHSIKIGKWFSLTKGDINKKINPSEISVLFKKSKNRKEEKKTFVEFIKDIITLERPINLLGSGESLEGIIVGYEIKLSPDIKKNKIDEYVIKGLLAFGTYSNKSYHKLTVVSTRENGLCIFDTFYAIIMGKSVLKNKKNKKNEKELDDEFNKLSNELQNYIRNGNLYESYIELSKLCNIPIYVTFYDLKLKNIKFEKGIMTIIDNNNEMIGKMVALWGGNHVAPYYYIIKKNIVKNKNNDYRLKPINIKKLNSSIIYNSGFDFETHDALDGNYTAKPFQISIFHDPKLNLPNENFYGENSEKEFCEYLNKIKTLTDISKTKKKCKVPKIYLWGFNNSNFDNLLFWKELHTINRLTKTCFTNSGIKYMKFYNIYIFDISLFYKVQGGLRKTGEAFSLEKEKGVFPYNFWKDPNFKDKNGKIKYNYIGSTPILECWKNKQEFEEYIKNNSEDYYSCMFNLKEYTQKYCMLDAEIARELGNIHINNSKGCLDNKRFFDLTQCATIGSSSIKLFQQGFQKDILYASSKKQQIKERKAYFGGHTQVYRPIFFNGKSNKKLFCYDINSSYPFSMHGLMPYKYISTIEIDQKFTKDNINEIVDYYLYYAKSKGTKEPNLVVRTNNNITLNLLNTDYNYHWGIELKTAIRNDFIIESSSVDCYEGKILFDDFIDYLYNQRLKYKEDNPALALLYKNLMNSSYGKYGQNKFTHKEICTDQYQEIKILSNEENLIHKITSIKNFTMIEYENINDDDQSIGGLVRLSSYIASKSRSYLHEMMREIGYDHVYYCDTDSIFSDIEMDIKNISYNILGKWKLEYSCEEAIFVAKKLYYIFKSNKEEKIGSKGVNPLELNKDNFKKMLLGEKIKTTNETMFYRSHKNGVSIRSCDRYIKSVLNTRKFNDKNESIPFNNIKEFELKSKYNI